MTSVVVGVLFLVALFFSPLIAAIPAIATAPVLIFVGLLMAQSLQHVPYDDLPQSISAMFTAVAIPLFFSITHGLAIGLLLYLGMQLALGRWKDVKPMTYLTGAIFIAFYMVG